MEESSIPARGSIVNLKEIELSLSQFEQLLISYPLGDFFDGIDCHRHGIIIKANKHNVFGTLGHPKTLHIPRRKSWAKTAEYVILFHLEFRFQATLGHQEESGHGREQDLEYLA